MTKQDHAQENGLNALRTVEKVLTEVGWEPKTTNIEGVLRIDFSIDKSPIADALADIRIDYERFLYYLNFRDRVPGKLRKQTMEFITRVNFDLVIGNFELNLDDGFVRFKASIDFTQVELNETLIRNVIRSAMDVVEQYANALVDVMNGEKKPIQAIKYAENGEADRDF